MELKSIFLNANMVAIYVGIILFFTQIHLPDVIGGTIDMLANMVGPMGMLLAGMAISEVPLKHVFMTGRNYLVVLLRLFVYPVIILAVFKLSGAAGMIPDGKNILMIVYLACITPACATVTSMAQLYDSNAAESSMFYVLTTICSIISMLCRIFRAYPSATSSIIIRLNPTAKHRVPTSEWRPWDISGISSSTTT